MIHSKYFLILNTVLILMPFILLRGQSPGIWAATDGVKVDKSDLVHPFKSGNSAWDGDTVRIFGATNEIVAFQVIVETGTKPLTLNWAGLKELVHLKSPEYRITYVPPDTDPTLYAGRPIQVFNVNYMEVKEATNASWIHLSSLPSAIDNPLGWKPVQLVPENALSGRGGYPLLINPLHNQSIWFDIYIKKDLIPGIYLGNVLIETSEGDYSIPVRLEIFDFSLPDENSLNAMFYFENGNPILYMGSSFDNDPGFHRFAHLHRVEFVDAYNTSSASDNMDRFSGKAFTPEKGYEGPGENTGNKIIPRTFYGTPNEWLNQATARNLSDEWMEFINENIPDAITFLYMPDEPGPSEFPFIKGVADNIHSNPGPGKDLKILVTHGYTSELEGYIDIWATTPGQLDKERIKIEKSKGNQMWFYNGGRPYVGAIINDAPATDTRMIAWAAFKENIGTYFYWHVCHWNHNWQFGPGPDSPLRKQNVWQNTITFERRPQYDDWANGDGVLIYPGRELIHPEEDRGINGPVSSVRMANFRRGMQDHLYLTMAKRRGQYELINEALDNIVPGVFMEVNYNDEIYYAQDPDVYDYYRYKLGAAISENDEISGWTDDLNRPSTVIIFPNPLSGNIVNIHFQSGSPCKIQVDIYNLKGQFTGTLLRAQSHKNKLDETINLDEMKLNLKQGIYFLQIKILYSNHMNETKILKLVKT
ncbi:MAG: hypothetical protein AMS26_18335 [Bacteroides sp. SM23_62]|nr:MAG: hypothetical protein AMS26_18335 [Bacteroides sp. SM23_62]